MRRVWMRITNIKYQTIATNLAINPVVPKSLECPYTNPPPLTSSIKPSLSIAAMPTKWITTATTDLITGCASYTTAAFWQAWRTPIYAS